MTEINTQPAVLPDEIEAELANMNPRVANILRRRMGLAPVEPEPPKVEPAPESARAALRKQLADLAVTVPAIDPEALQRLDAEMAEQAKAEQEAQARAQQAVAQVAKAQSEAVTAALEPIKARARARLSPVKRRGIASSVQIAATLPDEVVFQHSVFCQTVLPYRDPGPEVRVWEREQGHVSLRLEAGHVKDPHGRFVPVGLPYGPAARLILCHLNTEALKTGSCIVDAGDCPMSIRHYRKLKRIN